MSYNGYNYGIHLFADKDCNEEDRDDDYDCTSAMPGVKEAIIKILALRKRVSLNF